MLNSPKERPDKELKLKISGVNQNFLDRAIMLYGLTKSEVVNHALDSVRADRELVKKLGEKKE